jgi:hypothetical protein
MAKTDTAANNTIAPAVKAVATAPSATSVPVASQEFTEAQRSPESFLARAKTLFDGEPPEQKEKKAEPEKTKKEPETKPEAKAKVEAKEEVKAKEEDESKDEISLIPDDDEPAAKIEDEEEGDGKLSKAELARVEFEKRELKREWKAKVEAKDAEIADLKSRVESRSNVPETEGFFKGAQSLKDVSDGLKALEQWEAFYEDNEDGYTAQDGTEYDKPAVKKALRAVRAEIKNVPAIQKAFTDLAERRDTANAKAKKLFPWANDPDSKHHQVVLDLAKAHPEIAKAPDAAYALGLMTMGKLVESGKYKLVLSSAAQAKAEPAKAAVIAKPAAVAKPKAAPIPAQEEDENVGFASNSAAALTRAMSVFG